MKAFITGSRRYGEPKGPVDWDHPTAKDMPPIWREPAQHSSARAAHGGPMKLVPYTKAEIDALLAFHGYWERRRKEAIARAIFEPLGWLR